MSGLVASRQYFAGLAMAELLRDVCTRVHHHELTGIAEPVCSDPDWRIGLAIDAYQVADAMINAQHSRAFASSNVHPAPQYPRPPTPPSPPKKTP